MLNLIKLVLRRTETEFEPEIQHYIDEAIAELEMLGIEVSTPITDENIKGCIIAYCKWKFGNNPDAEQWHKIYTDKVEKLMYASGYGLPEG